MSDETVGGAEQLAAHAGIGHERTHQQEHRDDAEGVVGDRAHRGLADQLQGGRPVDEIGETGHADEAHGHADGHAQQHQDKQGNEADYGDGIGAHDYSVAFNLGSCISSGWKIRR
ncbi:UNVERIFIED_ORG: ABC-type nickel/cobalt efflux system permease component RcnA [Bradyrhizobium japonicum]